MKHAFALLGLIAAAGCAPNGKFVRSYFQEAGAHADSGHFGEAVMNNHLVMTGERSYVENLSSRFAQEVTSTVNFAFNSATLDASARETLREQARWIRQFPEVRFRVYGHTDLVGSAGYNKSLGLRRAQAVVGYLTRQGISRARLEAVASFGETQPLVVTQGRERRNRRTVTEVTGFVRAHPIIMDGRYAEVVYREYIKSAAPESQLKMAQDASLDE